MMLKTVISLLVILALQHVAHAQGKIAIYSGTARNARGLEPVVDKFEEALGGVSNENKPGPLRNGFREVVWDAAAIPFYMPGNFFRKTITTGLQCATKEDKFAVSNDPEKRDNLYDTFQKQYPSIFQAFTPERLFTPVLDNKMWLTFFVPGTNKALGQDVPAVVRGVGIVFVDVDLPRKTKMILYDQYNRKIGQWYVEPRDKGLSFLGIALPKGYKRAIKKVRVILGNAKLGTFDGGAYDVVVTDDFYYGEPQALKTWEGPWW